MDTTNGRRSKLIMIDAVNLEKELEYLDTFEFKKPIVLTPVNQHIN